MEWWQDLERVDAMRWTVLGWKVMYWLNRRCQVVKKGMVRHGEFVDEEEDPIWEHGILVVCRQVSEGLSHTQISCGEQRVRD